MQLTQACLAEFSSGDRLRGDGAEFQDRIRIVELGQSGALAEARGSSGETYVVEIDLRDVAEGGLGVYCDCPRFADGEYCKHLWATIKKLDNTVELQLPHSTLSFYEIEPGDLKIGRPIARRLPKADVRPKPAKSKKPPSQPQWKQQLSRIGDASQAPPTRSLPNCALQDAVAEKRHWFVFSVSQDLDEFALVVMQSVRKSNGEWGRPVAAEIGTSDLGAMPLPEERRVISLLEPIQEYQQYSYRYSYGAGYRTRCFNMVPAVLEETLHALAQTKRLAWKFGSSNQHFEDARPVQQIDTGAPWQLVLQLAPAGERLSTVTLSAALQRDGEVISLDSIIWSTDAGCALIHDTQATSNQPDVDDAAPNALEAGESDSGDREVEANADEPEAPIPVRLIRVDPQQVPLLRSWQEAKPIVVPKRSLPALLEHLDESHSNVELRIAPELGVASEAGVPLARCVLSQTEYKGTYFNTTLRAVYSEQSVDMDSPRRWWFQRSASRVLQRDLAKESQWLESLPSDDFVLRRDAAYLPVLQLPPDRFLNVISHLQDAGWEVLANGAPIRIANDFNIHVTSGLDWFDLHADADFDGAQASLPELLKAFRDGERFVRLDDGSCGVLPEEWLKRFVDLHARGEEAGSAVRFKKSQGLLLDAMLEEQQNVGRDRNFNSFCAKLKNFSGIQAAEAPSTFAGDLRDYQKLGLGWFAFLREFGFGGCLADDMGLGKTIQVLAMLDWRRRQRGSKANPKNPMSIVVVPKSLVFNWMEEAAKFVPKLRVMNYTGLDRRQRWEDRQEDPHLIVTTYGTLRNDAAFLHDINFDYLILDEAQAIKNPNSISAKASRLLQGDHRLAMTGTPVENHLGDLWSIFEFLNPKMLGQSKHTPKAATAYMDGEQDRRAVEQIGRALRPFILRRTKQQVLTELPDKVEQTLSCKMSPRQQKLYDQLREHYRLHLSNKVKELGLKKSKIHVLEALLRLRQAACDPRLVKPDCGIRGAKLDSLLEQLAEVIEQGHKVLIFSQFTKLLGLLRTDIDARSWPYQYLDGKTRNRAECVQRFQNDEDCKLFLISLKAGGNGLNLTAADYVFILDPWWNPAVEAQAIDRAHRIGQTKSVIAYRMICEATVEDKIIQLQAAKRELADAIISQDKSLISDLTAEDLQALLS